MLFSVAALLEGGAAAVRGQFADGFDPHANNVVHVVVVQPDGKILIGGDFTTLSPNGGAAVTRNHIARLNTDGTLDIAFDPNASGGDFQSVYSIVMQADGKILVGGSFTSIGGQARLNLARLDATTGLADSFDPNAAPSGSHVFAIALQADGKILVGGAFSNIGGQARNNIARLDAATGLADSFDANIHDGPVGAIALQADGKILVGGNFNGPNSIGGQTRNYIARLNAATGLADSFDPNPNSGGVSIAVQADGMILVGGLFTTIGGQTRNYIARLDATTGLADSFNPNANNWVRSITVQAAGKILAGGYFTTIGGQPRNYIARLDATTGLADSFDPSASGGIDSIAVQADGKILVGGNFFGIGGQPRNYIARLVATPCSTSFINRTTANGLGNNYVNGVFAGGGSVYAATNGGGLSISTDGGTSFTTRTTANGLGRDTVTGVFANGGTLYAATFGGGLSISTDGGTSFTNRTIANGLGHDATFGVFTVGSTVYVATFGGVSISTNGGTSFINRTTANGLGSNFVLGAFADGSTVYAATDGGLAISTDGGATFANRTTANGLGDNRVNGVFAVGARVYAATDAGGLSISTDGGASFTTRTTANGLGNDRVLGVFADGNTVYAATINGLAISIDGGTSFTNRTTANGLGSNGVLGVFADGGTVYAATEGGLSIGSCSPGPTPPAITSANNSTFTVGSNGSFTVTATGNPTPTLSESGALPSGVTFTPATGVLSGTPAAGTGGTYPITFTASNGVGSPAMQSFTLTVNQAPAITSANNTTFTVGSNGSFTVTATGNPTPTLSESGALPSGVTFTPATGVLSGTPAAGTAGTFPITFTASNGVGSPAMQSFTLTVSPAPQAPAITSANNTTFTVGSNGSFTVTATGNPTPTLSESGVLPSGVTFTPATGVLGGTPAAGTGGTYPITFTASNGVGSPAMQSFTLTVNQTPAITSANNTTFTVGSSSNFTVTATGNPTPTLSESGALPSGVTFTPATGVLGGAPATGTAGTYPITFTASNGVGSDAMQSFTLTVAPAPGASALDGFDPNADGPVWVAVVQPDGKILIGGEFTTVSPNGGATVTRNRIARLNPDGTVDTAFNPNANGTIYSIAVQADGKILAGGSFTNIGGQTRNNIARLDAATGAADSLDPNADQGPVFAIAVQTDGKILAGGNFGFIGGQTRNSIARLDATTGLADSFNPNANGTVSTIAIQTDGRILVGGGFSSIGGQNRTAMARLDPTTGLADSVILGANNNVRSIAVQADGKILAGGLFTSIGGQPRNFIARLDPATGLADSFNPNANNSVYAIAVQADGRILAGGSFTGANSIGGQPRNRIARLNPTSGLADSFDPNANSDVYALAVQADGKILAGGAFTTIAPNGGPAVTRNRIARLETDGRLDQTLNLGIAGSFVFATAVQPDGKILIGGGFSTVLGVARNNIARLNTDGTLDTTFNPNADSDVYAIAVQADGKILAGGFFFTIGGQPRNFIARLDAVTGAADSWNPNSNHFVQSIAVQSDGRVLVGGNFSGIGGQTRNYIARLDATSGLADSWNPNSSGSGGVYSIAVQADGKILACGPFNTIGGQTRNHIARLDATTGLADSFDPNPPADFNALVESIAVQADGKILACGGFLTIGGQTRNHIARLDPNTGLADSWDPNAGTGAIVHAIAVQADGKVLAVGSFTGIGGQLRNDIARLDGATGLADSFNPNADFTVFSIAVQADGKILAGGQFANIGGQPRSLFARLTNDTAALQNLTVAPTTVTWARGGSSPQFARVTFESSTDNVTYTPLGNGTAAGSNWTLTGLSFPNLQNFNIRARGYYRSGRYADGSIQESVRNVFVPPVLKILSITRPANGHIVLQCLGVPNQVNNLQVSPDLSPGSFMSISPAPAAADGTGAFSYDDSAAVGLTKRFYRLAFP